MKKIKEFTIGLAIGIAVIFLLRYYELTLTQRLHFYLRLFLIIPFQYICIYVHEFGHVLFGILAGIEISRVEIGRGKKVLFSLKINNIKLVIKSNPTAGFTYPTRLNHEQSFNKLGYVLYKAGGILLQVLLISFLIIAFRWNPLSFFTDEKLGLFSAFIASNIILIIFSIIPCDIGYNGGTIPNDGKSILSLILSPFDKEATRIEFLVNKAHCHVLDKEYNLAEATFREIISLIPSESLYSTVYLGVMLIKQLKIDESISFHEQLISTNPSIEERSKAVILNNLAWTYLMKFDESSLDIADRLSKGACEMDPENLILEGTRGCVLVARNKTNEGLEILAKKINIKKPIDEETNCAIHHAFVGLGCLKTGDKEMSHKIFKKLDKYKGHWEPDDKYLFEIIKSKISSLS